MTSFPDKALLEEIAAEMEERERKKKELQERKDAVKREYLQAVSTGGNGMDLSMLHTARSLREVVDKKEYDSIPGVLDKAVLPAGHTFGIKLCEMDSDSLGDWSEPFILTPDGMRDESIFDFFSFEDSPAGAWQAFLLHQMWQYLPLWWHANYNERTYVYSKEDLSRTFLGKAMVDPGARGYMTLLRCDIDSLDVDALDLSPEIVRDNGIYYVSCCFWTDFGGLEREYVKLTLKDGRLDEFFEFDLETLFEYNCGIVF